MKRLLAGGCCVLGIACFGGAAPLVAAEAAGQAPAAEPKADSWTSWWSWIDTVFGIELGGVHYGTGPGAVVGSDKLVHELRPAAGAKSIEMSGPIQVVLRQGPAQTVSVHTDDNIAPLILTEVRDGVLHVGVKPGASFRTRHPVGLTVELPTISALRLLGSGGVTCAGLRTELLELTIGGSGDVRIDDLRTPVLAVLVQGSGAVHLSGSAEKQGYVIEGSGEVESGELAGRKVAVRVSGSGSVHLWVSERLDVDISGAGDVVYRGRAELTQSVRGAGRVRREQ